MVDPEDPLKPDALNRSYGLRQAFALASVSNHFHDVALGTPDLWKRITLLVPEDPTSWMSSRSLLHHCASYAPYLELIVNVSGPRSDFTAEMIAQVFSSPDTTRKIKALEVSPSLSTWTAILSFLSSLPTLDTLVINDTPVHHIDLRGLSLSHVVIYADEALESISLPPSMEVLHLFDFPELAFLKQCPNLVEFVFDNVDPNKPLVDLLTLNHLKRLSVTINSPTSPLKNLQTPTLEFLRLEWRFAEVGLASIIPFCRQVSTGLTTLILDIFPEIWKIADFELLFISLPKLRNLELYPRYFEYIFYPIYALLHQKDNSKDMHLPSLKYLVVGHHVFHYNHPPFFPYWFLDLLTLRRVGETSYFHLDFKVHFVTPWDQIWSPRLRDKLRSILRGRQIEITYHNKRIEWLYAE
jgi:hypothetical protein